MKKKLTQKGVERITPPSTGRLEVFDAVLPGFGLRVTSTGHKSWFVFYRVNGRQRRMTLGPLANQTLLEARDAARDAMQKAGKNIDAASEVKASKEETCRNSVKAVVSEFINRYARKHQKRWHDSELTLNREIVSVWGERPITTISKRDVLDVLDSIMDRGKPYMANLTLRTASKMFNWSIERGIIETSPTAGIKPPGKEQSRDRVLTDDELITIWNACNGTGYPFGPLVQLLIATGQRLNEASPMRREDVKDGVWTIPDTKSNEPHTVPLPHLAVEILESLPTLLGPYVFSTTGGERPVSGFSKAKTRLDKFCADTLPPWRFHDARRTAATGMARLNIPPHVCEKVLNHRTGTISGVAGIYNRHGYEPEKAKALETWNNHLESLIRPSNKVVEMVRR